MIAIFTSENNEGIVAATIGVMDYNQGRPQGPALATEILLDARGHSHQVANIAATTGFYIMKDGWPVAPGVTFAEMVAMYEPELRSAGNGNRRMFWTGRAKGLRRFAPRGLGCPVTVRPANDEPHHPVTGQEHSYSKVARLFQTRLPATKGRRSL